MAKFNSAKLQLLLHQPNSFLELLDISPHQIHNPMHIFFSALDKTKI